MEIRKLILFLLHILFPLFVVPSLSSAFSSTLTSLSVDSSPMSSLPLYYCTISLLLIFLSSIFLTLFHTHFIFFIFIFNMNHFPFIVIIFPYCISFSTQIWTTFFQSVSSFIVLFFCPLLYSSLHLSFFSFVLYLILLFFCPLPHSTLLLPSTLFFSSLSPFLFLWLAALLYWDTSSCNITKVKQCQVQSFPIMVNCLEIPDTAS